MIDLYRLGAGSVQAVSFVDSPWFFFPPFPPLWDIPAGLQCARIVSLTRHAQSYRSSHWVEHWPTALQRSDAWMIGAVCTRSDLCGSIPAFPTRPAKPRR